jgi:signal transduction histidine kinase
VLPRSRELSSIDWRTLAITTAASLVLIIGGSALSAAYTADARPLDATAYVLLTLGGLAIGLALQWPLPALVLASAATSIFYSLDYSHASPLFLSVLAILFIGATAHQIKRSLLIGLVAFATAVGQHVITDGLAGLNAALLANIGWIAAAVLAGHAFAAQRDYVVAMRERALHAEQTRELEAQRRVTEERLRIARELHDVVSHTISVINVQAGVAAHVIEQHPDKAAAALETIRDASKEALRELRGILSVLRQVDDGDDMQPAPGLADLDQLVRATTQAGLRVTLTTSGPASHLSPTVELATYRIIQESLTNALRYAGGGCVAVKLAYERDYLTVEVDDSGGSRREPIAGGGHGIMGMRERASAVGGTLEAGPRVDGGFHVRAMLPVQA